MKAIFSCATFAAAVPAAQKQPLELPLGNQPANSAQHARTGALEVSLEPIVAVEGESCGARAPRPGRPPIW